MAQSLDHEDIANAGSERMSPLDERFHTNVVGTSEKISAEAASDIGDGSKPDPVQRSSGSSQKQIEQSDDSAEVTGDAAQASPIPIASSDGVNSRDVKTESTERLARMEVVDPERESLRIRSGIRFIAVLAGLYLSLFVAALDQTIVATAIPTISADLKSASGYTWIGGAYLLASAAASPIWAKFSDIWGRKVLLLGAVALFAISSIICAVSKNMSMLIAGRVLQGTGAGGLIQLVHIAISDIFSMRRTLYLGMLEAMWAIAGGAGPILGGVFSELASWRWIFWVNLPVSVSTFVLLVLFLDVHNPRTKVIEGLRAVDWLGSLSILGLTVMLLLGLNFGGTIFPWDSPKVICLIVFGALMSLCFIYSEKKLAEYPVMPLSVFTNATTAASLLIGFTHGFVFIVSEFYLPLYFQSVLAAGPLHSGLLILPICITEAVAGVATGIALHWSGRYQEIIWISSVLLAISNGLFIHLNADTGVTEVVIFQLIAGVAQGMLFEPPLIALQAFVSQDDTATATATFGFVRNLATAASIVIGGVVFQNGMAIQSDNLKDAGLNATLLEDFSGHSAAANVFKIGEISSSVQVHAVKEAYAWSLRNVWIMTTCIAVIQIIISLFIKKQKLSREHQETRTGIKKQQETSQGPRNEI